MKVGLMLPLGEDDGLGRALHWPELRAMAIAAETTGLDSIWAPDHLVFHNEDRVERIHESWTVLTAVAALPTGSRSDQRCCRVVHVPLDRASSSRGRDHGRSQPARTKQRVGLQPRVSRGRAAGPASTRNGR
jgi:hypothetical protein